MSNRLEKVTLCHFRGGTCPVDITFDPTKPVAVIFGENGDGKSSIVDAIGCSLRGDVGALKLVSVPGARTKYLPSVGSKAVDMQVSTTVGGKTWMARLSRSSVEIKGPSPVPPVHILRRPEVLKLITSEPKDRYSVLRGLIAVENIEESEKQLRQALKDAGHAVEFASERRAEAEKILNDLWREKGKPAATSALEWARAEVTANSQTLRDEIATAKGLLDAAAKASDTLKGIEAASQAAKDAEAVLVGVQERLVSAEAGEEASLLGVLEAAESVLTLGRGTCPVCEQSISVSDVRSRVTARLLALKTLRSLKAEGTAAAEAAAGKAAVLYDQRSGLIPRFKALAERVALMRGEFPGLPAKPPTGTDLDSAGYLADVERLRPMVVKSIEAKEERQYQQNIIATNVRAVDDSTASLSELQGKAKRLEAISAVVEGVRKTYINGVLTQISGSAAAMYARIHPEEPIGSVSLFLKQAAVGSLELSGSFASTQGIPPQAYYSESHLDTLGVCVFLATAQRDKDAIVVLDDVFTSVDDAHLSRILELLHDEATNVGHLIITTHYRGWRDRYKYARGPAANSQLIELLPWAHGHGIRHTKVRLSVEELKEAIAMEPLDRIGVAARAGILLEAVLDDLTLRYRCRMPRLLETHYTLGDFFGGIDSKLSKSMFITRPTGDIPLDPPLQQLASLTFLRNKVGCHFDLAGSNISDKDVRLFGEVTLTLANAMICEACGESPQREKKGQYWQCSCGLTKLTPVVRPGDKAV